MGACMITCVFVLACMIVCTAFMRACACACDYVVTVKSC